MLHSSITPPQIAPLRVAERSATIPLVAEDSPEEKPLRTVPFVIHATRGVIRDQTTRRKMMFGLLLVALLLVFAGSTFLAPILNPREHLGWSLLFWIACVWLTLTALLLALFDLLALRVASRAAERNLRQTYEKEKSDRGSNQGPNE